MDKLSWSDIYNPIRDFVYDHTELAIWIGIGLFVFILFWLIIYSIAVRRTVAVTLVMGVLLFFPLDYFGVIDAFFSPAIGKGY